jgi:lipoprotein-anchoring transpeptidase ErfK/SrfK
MLVALMSAFFVAAATTATIADLGMPLKAISADAETASGVDGVEIARPAPPRYLPFENPGAAYAGMGRDARATARPAPDGSGEGRRIVYAVRAQRVWLVEADGTVLDTYLVSGRKNLPRPGTYRVFSKSTKAHALYGGITMRYMVRFTRGPNGIPIGFHDLPRHPNGRPMQTTRELGTYQSGGCVRQDRAHAIQLYEWAPVGTKVVVLR